MHILILRVHENFMLNDERSLLLPDLGGGITFQFHQTWSRCQLIILEISAKYITTRTYEHIEWLSLYERYKNYLTPEMHILKAIQLYLEKATPKPHSNRDQWFITSPKSQEVPHDAIQKFNRNQQKETHIRG